MGGARRRTGMRRAAVALVLTSLLLVACDDAPEATGGIGGRVLAGPTCPVETEASPCPPQPWRGVVRATGDDGATYETETDADGVYALALPPGTYVVTAVTATGALPMAIPAEVTVVAGPSRPLDLEVDTGIR